MLNIKKSFVREIVTWKESDKSLSRKGNNIFEAEFSRGRIVRQDTPPELTYYLYLDEDSYRDIKSSLGGGYQWTRYEGSTVYYQGGNSIYIRGSGAMDKIKEILNLDIVW